VISRILRFMSVCVLLSIFLAGETGILFYIHTCGGSQKKQVLVFREIFHQKIDCCCDEIVTANVRGSSASTFNDDCCRISHLFIKIPFPGFPISEKFLLPAFYFSEYTEVAILKLQSLQDSKASFSSSPDPSPPPIYGVTLVHFLHQIRIPEPVC